MIKDLILITSYCDTISKENTLRNLIQDIEYKKEYFDIMIVSHLPVPFDITQKVNYVFYDYKNELLYDEDLRSTPWFNPGDERAILSCYTGFYNTHLAIWRMIILGNSIAKNCGYNKVHHIEYDASIKNFDELFENSKLLEKYDSVIYNKIVDTVDPILFGSYQSYRLDKIHTELIVLNEEKIKNNILKSKHKSPEKMLFDLLNHNNNVKIKNKSELDNGGNKFALSHNDLSNNNTAWCLPYYDYLTKKLGFVVWNMEENKKDIEVQLIYNDNKVHNLGIIKYNHWRLIDIDDYKNAKKLKTILNNKVRDVFDFDVIGETFKKVSYRERYKR